MEEYRRALLVIFDFNHTETPFELLARVLFEYRPMFRAGNQLFYSRQHLAAVTDSESKRVRL